MEKLVEFYGEHLPFRKVALILAHNMFPISYLLDDVGDGQMSDDERRQREDSLVKDIYLTKDGELMVLAVSKDIFKLDYTTLTQVLSRGFLDSGIPQWKLKGGKVL